MSVVASELKSLSLVAGVVNENANNDVEADGLHCSAACQRADDMNTIDSDADRSTLQQDLSDINAQGHVAGNTASQYLLHGCSNGPLSVTVTLPMMTSDGAHSSLPTTVERPLHRVSGVVHTSTTALQRRVCFSDKLQYREVSNSDGLNEAGCLYSHNDTHCTVIQPQENDSSYHLTPSVHLSLPLLPTPDSIDSQRQLITGSIPQHNRGSGASN